MKDQNALSDIIYLIEPEETWDSSRFTYKKRYGLEMVKFIFWYLVSMAASILLCCMMG